MSSTQFRVKLSPLAALAAQSILEDRALRLPRVLEAVCLGRLLEPKAKTLPGQLFLPDVLSCPNYEF